MFPTRAKDKISQSLMYPIKAKALSDALADAPQADEFELWFSNNYTPTELRRQTKFRLVGIWYHQWEVNRFMPRRPDESTPTWTIHIYAIHVEIKTRVTQLLQDEALPKLRAWLNGKAEITNHRSCRIEVFYHESDDCLKYEKYEK